MRPGGSVAPYGSELLMHSDSRRVTGILLIVSTRFITALVILLFFGGCTSSRVTLEKPASIQEVNEALDNRQAHRWWNERDEELAHAIHRQAGMPIPLPRSSARGRQVGTPVAPLIYSIRRAQPDEASALSVLARSAKAYWGYPEAWLDSWKNQLTFKPEYIKASPVYVAVDRSGVLAGCYAAAIRGAEAEIEHFWVHPDHTGRGVGRLMFSHAVELVQNFGCTSVIIESDPNAEGFYIRLGAERVGVVRADVCGTERMLPKLRFEVLRIDR